MVPRWRTAGSPIMWARSASAGIACRTTGESATSAWRAIAPITSARPFISIPDKPSILLRSMMCDGDASRSFMVGSRVWPPARSFASSNLPSMLVAWRNPLARWKVKLYIARLQFSPGILLRRAGGGLADRRPHHLRRRRHRDLLRADGIGDRVHHRRWRSDGAGLAATLDAERVRRTFRHRRPD